MISWRLKFLWGILPRKVKETDMMALLCLVYINKKITYAATWSVFCRHPVLVHIEWWFLYICLYLFSVLSTHNTQEQNLQKTAFHCFKILNWIQLWFPAISHLQYRNWFQIMTNPCPIIFSMVLHFIVMNCACYIWF